MEAFQREYDVVDSNLKAEHDNLYVCDCSVIPEAWGLPPTLTVGKAAGPV